MPLIASRRRSRAGVTLVELIIVLTLLAIVGGALMSFITRQQRFYRGTSQIMENRSQIRQAIAYLPVALRGISTAAGTPGTPNPDIIRMSTNGITFRQTIGTSIMCGATVSAGIITRVNLPPDGPVGLASTVLTRFISDPQVNDAIWVYSEGPDPASTTDDRWAEAQLLAPELTTGAVSCPGGGPGAYTVAADDAKPAWRLPISGGIDAGQVLTGAPMRLTRVYRDTLYQAGDGRWYLGHSACNAAGTTCDPPEPVAGPFRPYDAARSVTGLLFEFFDENGTSLVGNALANRAAVARIDVTVRGRTPTVVPIAGFGGAAGFDEEMKVGIAVRNRP